jgi:glycerol kinase
MTEPRHVLAIDQGTTSTRTLAFDAGARAVAIARRAAR